jgi:multidrug efflux pump subunit AcrA (membrane-fusion protein)
VPGEITRTSWALEASNRTLRTEIDLANDGSLRPGLYATVRIELETHPDVLTVPITALIHDAGQTFCGCVVDGHVERRPGPARRSGAPRPRPVMGHQWSAGALTAAGLA